MHINHIALWTDDIDRLISFYATYFGVCPGNRYINTAKGFESCFLNFSRGARIEVMKTTTLSPVASERGAQRMGLTHLAIAVGDDACVDALTRRLGNNDFVVLDGPRRTGDGYYESVVLDPDGNRIEITAD